MEIEVSCHSANFLFVNTWIKHIQYEDRDRKEEAICTLKFILLISSALRFSTFKYKNDVTKTYRPYEFDGLDPFSTLYRYRSFSPTSSTLR
jgi:hypothetical protein